MRMILVFLVIAQPVQAAVLIQGSTVPEFEYRAALKADPDLVSPVTQLSRQRPSAAQRELLLSKFAAAQKSFLENSKEEASAHFQAVVSLIAADDWSRADRQVFLHSYLRLAQLELSLEKQNSWLTRALGAGDDLELDAGLFPPPLLRTLANFRREVPRASLPKNIFADGWNMVLVNGIVCTKERCREFPLVGDKVRVTFLSDIWQPVTLTAEAGSFKNLKPQKIAWVSGDCTKTQFSAASLPFKDPKAFWGLACEAPPAGQPVNLQPVAQSHALPAMDIKERSPAFYKSKWFWGGVVLAAAVAIIVNGQKQKEEKEPTTTYGYH